MRARAVALVLAVAAATATAGDPKPKPVDVGPLRAKLVVLQDPTGGTYVVWPAGSQSRVWYGAGKTLYEQLSVGYAADGENWDLPLWAPRVPRMQPGSIQKKAGAYHRWCGDASDTPLRVVPPDRAKTVLDHATFRTSALMRTSYLLARDDHGVYYYVDKLRDAVGGGGYRVFVGKKGELKELPLSDVATDAEGDVFATKTGDVRFVHSASSHAASWARGRATTPLALLDLSVSSRLIFKDLGIYQFLGTICDDI